MTKKGPKKERLSPIETQINITGDFMNGLNIPDLPEQVPDRLADAVRKRVQALLYALKEAIRNKYAPALEIRLVRDAHRAVVTAYELGLPEGEIFYGAFRRSVEELGYERTEVGYRRISTS